MPSATASTPNRANGSRPTGPRRSADTAPTPKRHGDESTGVRIQTGPHGAMDCRAIACLDRALEDVSLTDEPSADHDSANDIPDGLAIHGRTLSPHRRLDTEQCARKRPPQTDCDYRL